jgi:hypothetical protein
LLVHSSDPHHPLLLHKSQTPPYQESLHVSAISANLTTTSATRTGMTTFRPTKKQDKTPPTTLGTRCPRHPGPKNSCSGRDESRT